MRLLVIDTAGWDSSIALWEDGRECAFQEKSFERDQAAFLPRLVKDIIGTQRIDTILVNVGPGSFTGIRVGIAFATGLSMGWGVTLKGMDSFTATYATLELAEDALVLIEARRSDIFAKRFINGIAHDPQCLTREEVETILRSPHPPLVAGNGFHPFLDGLSFKEAPSSWRGAQKLAQAFFQDPACVVDPLPFYIREADVTYAAQSSPAHP